MVKIRLAKLGKTNDPFYRIVAIEHRRKVTGKALATLGYWHPKGRVKKINKKGIVEWTKKGATVSLAVQKLLNG